MPEIMPEIQPYVPAPPAVRHVTLADALGTVHNQFFTVNNVTMVPLRPVAEELGFRVTWNPGQRSITIQHSEGQAFSTVTLDEITFEGRILQAAPTIRNDRAFVPLTVFEILLGQ